MVRPNCVVPESAGPPPDLKSRRAGSAATEHGSNRKKAKSKSQKQTNKKPKAPQEITAEFSAYDGRIRLASIKEIDGVFRAFAASDDGDLGTFATLKAAFRAVCTACEGAS